MTKRRNGSAPMARDYRLIVVTLAAPVCVLASVWAGSTAAAAPQPTPNGGVFSSLTVVLLGTGSGPPVNVRRYGPATLVEAGGQRLLFDCGRGATIRMAQYGIPLNSVTKIFLTHLHSDHVIGIPDLFLTPWSATGRQVPLEVWGPEGTRAMMDNMQRTFAFDIHVRRDVDEEFPGSGIGVISHDVSDGVVFNSNGVTVRTFHVDHGPVKPALGYRVDYAGRSVALSGDTSLSENLVRSAQGVDLLIHEAVDVAASRVRHKTLGLTPEQSANIIAHHTSAEDAGVVFSRVRPKMAVYSHIADGGDLITPARKTYGGPLEVGEDLMSFEIADRVEVHRRAP